MITLRLSLCSWLKPGSTVVSTHTSISVHGGVGALKLGALATILLFALSAFASADEAKPADVRLVIDVSGSMKRNDPANLRQPAVELLVQLLPEGSRAGVWTFGKWVNMLVKHRDVDQQWREQAQASSSSINSVGLFTNIGEALEKATYDIDSLNSDYRTSVILLTDGMVDIEKDPSANRQEWRRIVDEVLPKLKDAGIAVHTVALSENADRNLLNRLSLATDGIAEIALTADDLMRVFLKAFDVAAPAEQVPLDGNRFLVDSSVEEFTALIFRADSAEQIALRGPDKSRYDAATSDRDASWHRGETYDLITIKRPLEGEWWVDGQMAPESRVTVVSNLNLRIAALPNNVFLGQELALALSLQEDGKTLTAPEFLNLMQVDAAMEAGNDEFTMQQFWQKNLSEDGLPGDGVFRVDLPAFNKDGIYQLNVLVDGKSFVREFSHQFAVRQAFGAEVTQQFTDGKLDYILTVHAYNASVNYAKTKVVATLTEPDDRSKIRPLTLIEEDSWQVLLRPQKEGRYEAVVRVRGENNDGEKIDIELATVSFNFSLDEGFVEEKEPFFPEEKSAPEADDLETQAQEQSAADTEQKDAANDSQAAAASAPEVAPQPSAQPSAQSSAPIPPWMLYAALGLGNILLFSLGFFVYKKLLAGPKDDELLAEFEEAAEDGAQEQVADAQEDQIDEEEEPPMEDLDPVDDDDDDMDGAELDEMTSMLEDDPTEDMMPIDESDDVEDDMVAALADLDDEPDAMAMQDEADFDELVADEETELAMEDAEPLDEEPEVEELDDLDTMAAEAQGDGRAERTDDDDEEEDMVAAMLKAQGLDLADEELDDAISNLIDELGGEEEPDQKS